MMSHKTIKKQENKNRLEKTLQKLKSTGEKALTVYFMGGDPDYESSVLIIKAAVEGGADIIEIGVPFTDPLADGPVIQRAGLRSLRAGNTTAEIFRLAETIRKQTETPMALMLYYNIIHRYGVGDFFKTSSLKGIDALIIPDLPPEEREKVMPYAKENDIILIDFITPTTPPERVEKILNGARGFIYCVSVTGVTGMRKEFSANLKELVTSARAFTDLPILAGFGISSPGQAREVSQIVDGVIVGSSLVCEIEIFAEEGSNNREKLIASIKNKVSDLKNSITGQQNF